MNISLDILEYNANVAVEFIQLCANFTELFAKQLPEAVCKVWHGRPVWFINGNPVVGYDLQKHGLRVLFWSGQSFDELALMPSGSFKAAQCMFTSNDTIDYTLFDRLLTNVQRIPWDYV